MISNCAVKGYVSRDRLKTFLSHLEFSEEELTEFIRKATNGKSDEGFTELELYSNAHVYDVTSEPCSLMQKINENQGLTSEVRARIAKFHERAHEIFDLAN